MSEFDQFWASYPRKAAKFAAVKAYGKAVKIDSPERIFAGLLEYRKHLPDDAQFIPHAATWLNQGRWMDEYEVRVDRPHWFDECKSLHGGVCDKRWNHEMKKRDTA